MKIANKSLPDTKKENAAMAAKPAKRSDGYAGKYSEEVGQELQKHVAQSRNEWERNI